MRHYDGRELWESLCEAYGYDATDLDTLLMVRADLEHGLGAPVALTDVSRARFGHLSMDRVLDWCAAAGINVVKLHGERAQFRPSIPSHPDRTEVVGWRHR